MTPSGGIVYALSNTRRYPVFVRVQKAVAQVHDMRPPQGRHETIYQKSVWRDLLYSVWRVTARATQEPWYAARSRYTRYKRQALCVSANVFFIGHVPCFCWA
jgi:hypothetical protein